MFQLFTASNDSAGGLILRCSYESGKAARSAFAVALNAAKRCARKAAQESKIQRAFGRPAIKSWGATRIVLQEDGVTVLEWELKQ